MESGIVTSYKNKGIIILELISLPFFLRSSNICLKNCFSDKFSLRAFIFPHAKFVKTRNLHLLWLQTVMSYTDYTMTPCIQKVFIATYICIWSTMYNHYANSHIMLYMTREGPYLISGNKSKLVAWTLHRFYVLKLTHPLSFCLLYDDDTIYHAANDIKRIFLVAE